MLQPISFYSKMVSQQIRAPTLQKTSLRPWIMTTVKLHADQQSSISQYIVNNVDSVTKMIMLLIIFPLIFFRKSFPPLTQFNACIVLYLFDINEIYFCCYPKDSQMSYQLQIMVFLGTNVIQWLSSHGAYNLCQKSWNT